MLKLNTDMFAYLQRTTQRLAQGLAYAYVNMLPPATDDSPLMRGFRADAAALLLSGQFNHLVNYEGAQALAELQKSPMQAVTLLTWTPPDTFGEAWRDYTHLLTFSVRAGGDNTSNVAIMQDLDVDLLDLADTVADTHPEAASQLRQIAERMMGDVDE